MRKLYLPTIIFYLNFVNNKFPVTDILIKNKVVQKHEDTAATRGEQPQSWSDTVAPSLLKFLLHTAAVPATTQMLPQLLPQLLSKPVVLLYPVAAASSGCSSISSI